MPKLMTWQQACCLAICLVLAMTVTAAPTAESQANEASAKYGVMLDAGSSSTKLKVYRWIYDNPPVPRISLLANNRSDKGLGAYEDDAAGLISYLRNITSIAQNYVPSDKQKETPIYLMATAGLRYLTAGEANVFLDKIRAVLSNASVHPFLYNSEKITILSGEEEGVYSWIAANYLLGYFDQKRPENETIGILEMGGGSTQIAFIPDGPIFSEEYNVVVAGRAYQLYVQSYLQFGADAIALKVVNQLLKGNMNTTTVQNPCRLLGDDKNSTLEDGTVVMETGTSSPDQCLDVLKTILKPDTGADCSPKPCAIGHVYQPSVGNFKFVATQAFNYAPSNLKVVGEDKILHLDVLLATARAYCNQTLEQASNGTGIAAIYATSTCLMGLYIPTLMTTSYGFSFNTTNINVTSKIAGAEIDWALGAMLVELSNNFGTPKYNFSIQCTKGLQPSNTTPSSSTSLHSRPAEIFLFLILVFIASNRQLFVDIADVLC